MNGMNIGKMSRQLLTAVTLACALPCLALGAEPVDKKEAPKERSVIPWKEAGAHVGEKVTLEGQIVATHTSPLSTLLSFDQSFSSFTAVIRPVDRGAFPPEPEKYYRGKQVEITGTVVEYDNKAEIVLKSPDQIRIIEPKAAAAPAPAKDEKGDEIKELALELIDRLAAIEARLEGLSGQLDLIITALEQQPPPAPQAARPVPWEIPPTEPPPRPRSQALRSIKRGMPASQVEKLLGPPAYIDATSEGGEMWFYGGGRTVTFNHRGRIEATAGFSRR